MNFIGCLFIYFAILMHGCTVREAATIQADAAIKAAQVKCK